LKQKTNAARTETLSSTAPAILASEEKSKFASLSASLSEIRKLKGVIGYILRTNTSAIIDLADPEKLTEYAILSYEIHDACQAIAKDFSLGETESMLVEGENVKVLCMGLEENKVSVFMEKNATHAWIIKRILL
jgi:predicted regulator of Ras-like GTPase activity (Roadblock/LC7/MglB family)